MLRDDDADASLFSDTASTSSFSPNDELQLSGTLRTLITNPVHLDEEDKIRRESSSSSLARDLFFARLLLLSTHLGATGNDRFETAMSMLDSPMLSQMVHLGLLGSGAFGRVYKVRSKLDGCVYAIKTVPISSETEPWACEAHEFECLKEVRTMARCRHVPNVIRYHACWIEPDWERLKNAMSHIPLGHTCIRRVLHLPGNDDTETTTHKETTRWPYSLYILMDAADTTLCTWLAERNETLDAAATLTTFGDVESSIFVQLVQGLVGLHEEGIVHKDLKPSNILMSDEIPPNVRIADFGLSHTYTSTSACEGGTPSYSAPEQRHDGSKCGPMVDMYALGIILIELCVPFFTGMERAVTILAAREKGLAPKSMHKCMPEHACLVESLLSPDPCMRPSSKQVMELVRQKQGFFFR